MRDDQYLQDVIAEFRKLKKMADKAIAQVTDADLFATIDPETNSVAINMKHITGNMRSRWTDFFTTDGEKPDRNRDSEFIIEPGDTASVIGARWQAGWNLFLGTLDALETADLERVVLIRGEPHTVVQAIHRQLTHYAYHVGNIVLLAKHFAGPSWRTLTIARGQSGAFNAPIQHEKK